MTRQQILPKETLDCMSKTLHDAFKERTRLRQSIIEPINAYYLARALRPKNVRSVTPKTLPEYDPTYGN